MNSDIQFNKAMEAITDLLEMYEINTADPDTQQQILNCTVAIDNYYNGFDDDGNRLAEYSPGSKK